MTFESKDSEDILKYALGVLKKVYKVARKKEDTATMIGIADRLLVLFESMSDMENNKRQHPTGFARAFMEVENDRE